MAFSSPDGFWGLHRSNFQRLRLILSPMRKVAVDEAHVQWHKWAPDGSLGTALSGNTWGGVSVVGDRFDVGLLKSSIRLFRRDRRARLRPSGRAGRRLEERPQRRRGCRPRAGGLDGGQGQSRSLALLRDDYVHPRWRRGQCERAASGGAVLPPAGISKEQQQAVPRPDRVSDLRQERSEGL